MCRCLVMLRLKVVLAPTDCASGRSEDPKDRADHDEYATNCRQQRDAHQQTYDEQNQPKNNHYNSDLSSLFSALFLSASGPGSGTGRPTTLGGCSGPCRAPSECPALGRSYTSGHPVICHALNPPLPEGEGIPHPPGLIGDFWLRPPPVAAPPVALRPQHQPG